MDIIANKDFTFNGEIYSAGDVIKVSKDNIDKIWSLNEKGLIEPISVKDFMKLRKEIFSGVKSKEDKKVEPVIIKEEEE